MNVTWIFEPEKITVAQNQNKILNIRCLFCYHKNLFCETWAICLIWARVTLLENLAPTFHWSHFPLGHEKGKSQRDLTTSKCCEYFGIRFIEMSMAETSWCGKTDEQKWSLRPQIPSWVSGIAWNRRHHYFQLP